MVRLELQNVVKRWPGLSVSVDLAAEAGSILAIAGPSGCGKSTLLRIAAGLEAPDSGSVLLGGRDVTGLEPGRRGVGMVFQDYALFPHLDVQGNVEYGLRVRRVGRRERIEATDRLLSSFGLSGFGKRKVDGLSGGERQRVALARTLAAEPRAIMFDEPFSSLDAALRKRLRAELASEQRRLGFTAIHVTHDLEEAMALGDSLAIMDGGRLLQVGPPESLWLRPADRRVASFMGSGPSLAVDGIVASGGRRFAYTQTGRFELDGTRLAEIEAIMASGRRAYAHFERSSARIAGLADDGGGPGFSAKCERADFAGDVVDCAMSAGSEAFQLRFQRGQAPLPGSSLRYSVEPGNVSFIPDTRTRPAC